MILIPYVIFRFALIHLCVNTNAKDRLAGQFKDHVFSGNYFPIWILLYSNQTFSQYFCYILKCTFSSAIQYFCVSTLWQKYLLKITNFVSTCTENKTNLMDGQGANKKEELRNHTFRGKKTHINEKALCFFFSFLCGQNLCYYFLRKFIKKYAWIILFVLLQNSIILLGVCNFFNGQFVLW